MRIRFGLLLTFLVALVVAKPVSASEWKYFGSSSGNEGEEAIFLDVASIQRNRGIVRFWTKTIPIHILDSFEKENSRVWDRMVDTAARKLVTGYIPPFLFITEPQLTKSKDDNSKMLLMNFIIQELIANESTTRHTTMFCREIDIRGRRMRILDGSKFDVRGNQVRHQSFLNSVEWDLISPDTMADGWLQFFTANK